MPTLPAFQLSPRLIAPLAGTLVAVAFVAWILLLTWGTDDPEEAGSPPETAAAPVAPQQPQTVRTVDLPEPQVRTEPPLSASPAAMDQSAAPAIAADDGNRAGNGADGRPDVAILTSDRPLAGQPLPPAFGSILRYGADGRIVATPEGVVTPGGFLLVAGRPPRVRRDEAREAVATFILKAHQQGRRCLRVVHGKGHGSPGRQPILKSQGSALAGPAPRGDCLHPSQRPRRRGRRIDRLAGLQDTQMGHATHQHGHRADLKR